MAETERTTMKTTAPRPVSFSPHIHTKTNDHMSQSPPTSRPVGKGLECQVTLKFMGWQRSFSHATDTGCQGQVFPACCAEGRGWRVTEKRVCFSEIKAGWLSSPLTTVLLTCFAGMLGRSQPLLIKVNSAFLRPHLCYVCGCAVAG